MFLIYLVLSNNLMKNDKSNSLLRDPQNKWAKDKELIEFNSQIIT